MSEKVLTRKEYVERIHDCYRGQGMGIATHDVLMHHDAALRAEVADAEGNRDACHALHLGVERQRDAAEAKLKKAEEERDEALVSEDAAHEHLKWEKNCGCMLDRPDDVCMAHSPAVRRAEARVAELEKALREIAEHAYEWESEKFERIAARALAPARGGEGK